jgi:hypothetical protein
MICVLKVIGTARLYSEVLRECMEDEVTMFTVLTYQGRIAIQNAIMHLMLNSDMMEPKDTAK